jgi:muramoyltetrapeptide carboxypeptidase
MATRRRFLATATAGLCAASVLGGRRAGAQGLATLKARRLQPGDRVGLVNTAQPALEKADLGSVNEVLSALDLEGVPFVARAGASDEERAEQLNAAFRDPSVSAVLPVRGGYGAARLLEHLDYDAIARQPKVIMGYSDVASLLVGIHARTGLVTFHGPMGNSAWVPFTVNHVRRVLFEGGAQKLVAREPRGGEPAFRTIRPGVARGHLLGGNLTVLSSIVGTRFMPEDDELILFVEEVREPLSEVDRMLTQLELAGVLDRVTGFVFGQCTSCAAPLLDKALTLDRVIADHVKPLGIPAWSGAPIGHLRGQLTLPIGLPVEIDAAAGTIQLLESAVL